jgi:hypothetical protein
VPHDALAEPLFLALAVAAGAGVVAAFVVWDVPLLPG